MVHGQRGQKSKIKNTSTSFLTVKNARARDLMNEWLGFATTY
jgi:hypothetical protein